MNEKKEHKNVRHTSNSTSVECIQNIQDKNHNLNMLNDENCR